MLGIALSPQVRTITGLWLAPGPSTAAVPLLHRGGARTGIANADARIAWAYHVGHVLTVAAERAASRAIELALSGDGSQRVPFHELVREEQREAAPTDAGR
ncbi:MAG: hypothetical protein ACRDRJ_07885 [Streptosporangiaceae bacterium]